MLRRIVLMRSPGLYERYAAMIWWMARPVKQGIDVGDAHAFGADRYLYDFVIGLQLAFFKNPTKQACHEVRQVPQADIARKDLLGPVELAVQSGARPTDAVKRSSDH
jgi:hypothetical protein